MTVRISFSNGETLDINEDTYLKTWVSIDRTQNKDDMYYAKMVFEGSNFDGSSIGTSDPVVGLQGLFGNSDWFSTIDLPNKTYKTSSIVSLDYL